MKEIFLEWDEKPSRPEPQEIDIWRFNKHKTTTKYPKDHMTNQLYRCMVTLKKFETKIDKNLWTNRGQLKLELKNFRM